MNKDSAQKLIDKYDEVSEKYVSSKYIFSKLLVTISITLVGLLASLTNFETLDHDSRKLFLTSLSILVLCILFSLIFLFSEQSYLKKEAGIRMNMLSSYMLNPSEQKLQVEYSGIGKFFLFCEKMSFFCFGIWSISLILYIQSILF
jgi:hypothetical protein